MDDEGHGQRAALPLDDQIEALPALLAESEHAAQSLGRLKELLAAGGQRVVALQHELSLAAEVGADD